MLDTKKIAILAGTRPELIKVMPIIKYLNSINYKNFDLILTGQHFELIKPILDDFNITNYFFQQVNNKKNTLTNLTSVLLSNLSEQFSENKYDWVLVQGDTNTAMAGALAGFQFKINVAHIEAGLRTYNNFSPFPEEANRRLISTIANIHFAPTEQAKTNLIKENISQKDIIVTGNTSIDALSLVPKNISLPFILKDNKKIILFTSHRRENIGKNMKNVFSAINEIAKRDDVQIVFPTHKNPEVLEIIKSIKFNDNVTIIEPLSYFELVTIMRLSSLIITDSGGLQEESPTFGIPVLVTRDTTERPEGVEHGVSELVNSDKDLIINRANHYLDINFKHNKPNPYGDGNAAKRIVEHIIG